MMIETIFLLKSGGLLGVEVDNFIEVVFSTSFGRYPEYKPVDYPQVTDHHVNGLMIPKSAKTTPGFDIHKLRIDQRFPDTLFAHHRP